MLLQNSKMIFFSAAVDDHVTLFISLSEFVNKKNSSELLKTTRKYIMCIVYACL